MMRLALTWRTAQRASELLVTAHPWAHFRDLLGDQERLFVNDRMVTGETSLADAGLRDGAVVSTQPVQPTVPVAPPGSLALLVASGTAAGVSCAIPAGGLVVGRSAPLALHDGEVSTGILRSGRPATRSSWATSGPLTAL